MLPRTLEPEVMDSPAEARQYDAMDHSAVNARFVEDLVAALSLVELTLGQGNDQELPTGRLDFLDLGTGTAQIPILLCRRLPATRVMGADAAIPMLELAQRNVELAGLRDQIQLDQVDAKQLHYSDQMFAVTMSNSIVHHIPEPLTVLAEALRVTRRDGLLFFRDLTRPASAAAVEDLVASYAADCDDDQRRLFRESLHAALTLDEIRTMVGSLGFDPATVQMTSDRHWTWIARRN